MNVVSIINQDVCKCPEQEVAAALFLKEGTTLKSHLISIVLPLHNIWALCVVQWNWEHTKGRYVYEDKSLLLRPPFTIRFLSSRPPLTAAVVAV